MLRSTLCKLENQEILFSTYPKAKEPGMSISEGRNRWRSQLKQRESQLILYPLFFALLILSAYRMMFVHTGRVNLHTQSTESNVHLFQSTDKPERMFYQQSGHHLGQSSKLAHKIDQHILFYDNGKYIHFLVVLQKFTVMD